MFYSTAMVRDNIHMQRSVFDGVAYLPELPSSRNTCILETDGKEGIYAAENDDMIAFGNVDYNFASCLSISL